ncbi:regulatory protein GemA [Laribacter hongkongensis]|uniref:gp16 family protein n=1 Tax=Laribacter hongkongensis TaxID=168471 RepID=UPI001EFD4F9C|nr:regulatory protein GemA [Laribacter hongkongensis]MCG8993239.1 regulatory protein GemA [Laribacter hongkongensis]MCG8997942.1 regulatory protein GemA [Laribacter hongkongensis]MCG9002347.1 regulatory protein GemA [Laribacter hongkongensis]MCG9005657.1 regulatory protein GemA [Laribacter hongkongensis]MCG9008794.1 regulatory protein GemA [Laribacter hongkongensis]
MSRIQQNKKPPRPHAALAKIHIAKKALAMDDATYRAMLQSVAGVSSSKALSDDGVTRVLAHLQRCGWKPKTTAKAGKKPSVGRNRQALIGKVEALLAEAKRPWGYADSLARRMFGVEKTDWLDAEQLAKLVAALTYDAKRHGRSLG